MQLKIFAQSLSVNLGPVFFLFEISILKRAIKNLADNLEYYVIFYLGSLNCQFI